MHAKYAIVLHSIVQLYEQYKIQTDRNGKELRKLVLNRWQDQAQRIIKCDKTQRFSCWRNSGV